MPVLCENRLEINNGEDIEKDKFNSIKQIGCTLVETIQRVPAVVQPFPDPYISSKVYTSLNEHARKLKSKSLVQGKLHSLTVPFNIRQFSSKSSVPVSKKECIVKEPICKKKKECRKIPRKCPNFVLPDCECRVVSICEHPYKGVNQSENKRFYLIKNYFRNHAPNRRLPIRVTARLALKNSIPAFQNVSDVPGSGVL